MVTAMNRNMICKPPSQLVDPRELAREAIRQQINESLTKMVLWLENKFTVLHAPKRSGKSTTLTMFGVWFKKILKKKVITVGSEVAFRPAFGRVFEISIGDFSDQMRLINELARDKRITTAINNITDVEVQKAFAKEIFSGRGIILYDSLVVLDEMRKIFGRRKSMSKINDLMDTFVMQMGHWYVTVIGTIPKWTDLDNYAIEQLDWRGEVSRDEFSHEVHVDFLGKSFNFDITFNGQDYYKFFNSRNVLGVSDSTINLKDFNV